MDVLHRDLEAVEEPRLRDLHLLREALDQVLVHDAVRRGKERQHVGDEVLLVVVEVVPVAHVVGEVDLLRRPERRLRLLVLRTPRPGSAIVLAAVGSEMGACGWPAGRRGARRARAA